MTLKTLRFIFGQPLKQCLTGGKREEDGNTKIWISRERKELFRWNKKHFLWFLKGYHLMRNKILIKNSGHKLWRKISDRIFFSKKYDCLSPNDKPVKLYEIVILPSTFGVKTRCVCMIYRLHKLYGNMNCFRSNFFFCVYVE